MISIYAVTIRMAAAASRFAFLILASKLLATSEFGTYGLALSYVALFAPWLGLEFYIFSQRQALSSDGATPIEISAKQVKFNFLSFIVFLPIIAITLITNDFTITITVLLVTLIFFEYLSQELSRILVFLLKPVAATLVIFARNGIWPIFGIYLLLYNFELSSAKIFIVAGCIGGAFACICGGWFVFRHAFKLLKYTSLTLDWIKRGLKEVKPFIASAIAFKLLELQDRFVLEHYHGTEQFAAYFLLATLAGGIQLVLGSAVGQIWGPRMIRAFRQGDHTEYLRSRKNWILMYFTFGSIATVAAIVIIQPTLEIIGKPEFLANLNLFYVLLAAQLTCVLAEFWQVELYARDLDHWIPISAIVALVGAVTGSILLIPSYAGLGAAIASLIGFILLAICRYAGILIEESKRKKASS